jgi:hypothetical protein
VTGIGCGTKTGATKSGTGGVGGGEYAKGGGVGAFLSVPIRTGMFLNTDTCPQIPCLLANKVPS